MCGEEVGECVGRRWMSVWGGGGRVCGEEVGECVGRRWVSVWAGGG